MEKEEKEKNYGYKAVIIILTTLLIFSNVIQFTENSDTVEDLEKQLSSLYSQMSGIYAEELDVDYLYMKSIEPMGFINYTTITDATGDTRGVRSIIYNGIFYKLSKEQANRSIEIWEGRYICDAVFSFDNAAANDCKPMQAGKLYRMYYYYRGYDFLSIIYYEEVETGKIY